jgi:hypothetical protein
LNKLEKQPITDYKTAFGLPVALGEDFLNISYFLKFWPKFYHEINVKVKCHD